MIEVRMSIFDESLGRQMNAHAVADLLELSLSTIYRDPTRYGGVKIGGRWRFYERFIVETINKRRAEQDARQKENSWKALLLRQGDSSRREGEGEKIPSEVGCEGVGRREEAGNILRCYSRHDLWKLG